MCVWGQGWGEGEAADGIDKRDARREEVEDRLENRVGGTNVEE